MKLLANTLYIIALFWSISIWIMFFKYPDLFSVTILSNTGLIFTILCGSIWIWYPWLYKIGR